MTALCDEPMPAWASIRTDDYQYTEYYEVDGVDVLVTFREYYDLAKDPYQLDNVLADGDPGNDPDPITLTRLTAQLLDDRDCRESNCP